MIFARSFARASGPNNPSASRSGTAGAAAVAAAGGSAAGALLAWTSERVSMSTSTAAASAAAASVASAARTKLAPLAGSRWLHLQQQQRIWTATTTSASDGFKTAAPAPLFPSSLLKPSNTAPSWSPAYRLFSGGSSGTSPTAATASPTASPSFVAWYESKLQAHPIPTKMVTGGILWSVGDAVAQILPPLTHGESPPEYDWGRTGRAGFFGFAIHAPTSHVHFNFLEWMTVRSGLTGLQIPIFKVRASQTVGRAILPTVHQYETSHLLLTPKTCSDNLRAVHILELGTILCHYSAARPIPVARGKLGVRLLLTLRVFFASDLQLHVPRGHGCDAGHEPAANLRPHRGRAVGHAKGKNAIAQGWVHRQTMMRHTRRCCISRTSIRPSPGS